MLESAADHYRQQADECVALAKAAIRNEVRALHYAMAERYRRLAEAQRSAEAQPAE